MADDDAPRADIAQETKQDEPEEKEKKVSALSRVRTVLAPERKALAASAVAIIVASFGNFSFPALVAFIIDRSTTTGGNQRGKDSLVARLLGDLKDRQFLAVCTGLFATTAMASYFRTLLLGSVTARCAKRLRKKVFDRIIEKNMSFYDSKEVRTLTLLIWPSFHLLSYQWCCFVGKTCRAACSTVIGR